MYKLIAILFCFIQGLMVHLFGWIALLWTPLGFIVGLFSSANIILPILMGFPLAIKNVSTKQMKPIVFLALLRTPLIWFFFFFALGWFFPSIGIWMSHTQSFVIGSNIGFFAILLSPFSKKAREDFRSDFDKSYGKYYTDNVDFSFNHVDSNNSAQTKEVEALIKVSSNLYIRSMEENGDKFNFQKLDSRFRYMIFCLSVADKACRDYMSNSDLVLKESIHFLSNILTSRDQKMEYFGESITPEVAEKNALESMNLFSSNWIRYGDLLNKGEERNAVEEITNMICATESDKQTTLNDIKRLGQFSEYIQFVMKPMSMAFKDSIKK